MSGVSSTGALAGPNLHESHLDNVIRIMRMDLSAEPEALPALVTMGLSGAGSAY
jgi:hypothetical protein